MVDWLIAHVRFGHQKLSVSKKSDWYAGAFVAYAPVSLAGPYACGDVTRTMSLFKLLHKRVLSRGMGPAYDRERRLLPIMLELEAQAYD